MSKSLLEEQLLAQIRAAGLPEPEREVKFCDTRRWRFDFCFREQALAVEVQGGQWVRGRHNRPQDADFEKQNAAVVFGWRVLNYTGDQVKSGYAVREIAQALRTPPEGV